MRSLIGRPRAQESPPKSSVRPPNVQRISPKIITIRTTCHTACDMEKFHVWNLNWNTKLWVTSIMQLITLFRMNKDYVQYKLLNKYQKSSTSGLSNRQILAWVRRDNWSTRNHFIEETLPTQGLCIFRGNLWSRWQLVNLQIGADRLLWRVSTSRMRASRSGSLVSQRNRRSNAHVLPAVHADRCSDCCEREHCEQEPEHTAHTENRVLPVSLEQPQLLRLIALRAVFGGGVVWASHSRFLHHWDLCSTWVLYTVRLSNNGMYWKYSYVCVIWHVLRKEGIHEDNRRRSDGVSFAAPAFTLESWRAAFWRKSETSGGMAISRSLDVLSPAHRFNSPSQSVLAIASHFFPRFSKAWSSIAIEGIAMETIEAIGELDPRPCEFGAKLPVSCSSYS